MSRHLPRVGKLKEGRARRYAVCSFLASSILVSSLMVGCGGSSSTAASGSSKASFVKKANAVCDAAVEARSRAIEAVSTEIAESGKKTSIKAERRRLVEDAIAPADTKMVVGLERLTPSAGDEKVIGKIVRGLGEGIEKIEAEPELAFEPVVITHADVLAERYGLPECRV